MNEKLTIPQIKPTIHFEGMELQVKITGEDTAGAFSVVEFHLDPVTLGAPLHVHHNEDLFLTVLDGELVIQIDEQAAAIKSNQSIKIRAALLSQYGTSPIDQSGFWKYCSLPVSSKVFLNWMKYSALIKRLNIKQFVHLK
jgi:hypothetical protein